jgi:hypothetical protein
VIRRNFVDHTSSGPTTLFLREIYERMIAKVIGPEQNSKPPALPALRSRTARAAIDGREARIFPTQRADCVHFQIKDTVS